MNEVWKDCPGYSGLYEVSNRGAVRSVDRIDCRGLPRRGRAKISFIGNSGYERVQLSRERSNRKFGVHRLVAMAFCPGRDGTRNCVNHKDGNKLNNRNDNLEWCSLSENSAHAYRARLQSRAGVLNSCAKLDDVKVREIRRLALEGVSGIIISRQFKVARSTVSQIKNGETWAHV